MKKKMNGTLCIKTIKVEDCFADSAVFYREVCER